jgi:5-formyltetrahydrofolate cyclo-ligase
MRSDELKKAKRALRHALLAVRDGLPEAERVRRGERACRRFLSLPEVREAEVVLGFWSFGSEVVTQPLLDALHERGAIVALPRIVGGELEIRSWGPQTPMSETSFGAREPRVGALLERVDVICTPGVAFDRRGRRVGYGGGFYDRLFSRDPEARRIGLAFDLQIVEGDLPASGFDVSLDVLVTEARTLRWERD